MTASQISAESQLEQAYAQWGRLAQTEGEAIRARDWPRLAACQDALQEIQPRITSLIEQARGEWKACGADCRARENPFKTIVEQLMECARRNRALLQEALSATRPQLSQFRQATHTLRRLRASYSPAHPAGWSSLS